ERRQRGHQDDGPGAEQQQARVGGLVLAQYGDVAGVREEGARERAEGGDEGARHHREVDPLPERGADAMEAVSAIVLGDERGHVLAGPDAEAHHRPGDEEPGDRPRDRLRGVPREEQAVHEDLDREGHLAEDEGVADGEDLPYPAWTPPESSGPAGRAAHRRTIPRGAASAGLHAPALRSHSSIWVWLT